MPRPRRLGPQRRLNASTLGVNEVEGLLTGRPFFHDLTPGDLQALRQEHGEWVDAAAAEAEEAGVDPWEAVREEAKRLGVWADN